MKPTPSLPVRIFITRLPKVELHLHLEGSIRPETLRELARAKGRMHAETEQWIENRTRTDFHYRSAPEFLQAFKLLTLLLDTPQDYALATTRLCGWLAEQNVKYAEITLSAGVILWKKQNLDAIFEAVLEAASAAEQSLGLRVQWIFDAIRHFGADHAREVLGCAKRFLSRGVVAFGIGGDEQRGPADLFTKIYKEARDMGLHTTAHAGESAGPESIRAAVELLGAERIGHGLTAVRDPSVMAMLRERAIPVEVCPTSNVCTGLVPSFKNHPLPSFIEAGLNVSLNSDDPGLFGTSLENEFESAAGYFDLSTLQLAVLTRNAIQASFLPENEKENLMVRLRSVAKI